MHSTVNVPSNCAVIRQPKVSVAAQRCLRQATQTTAKRNSPIAVRMAAPSSFDAAVPSAAQAVDFLTLVEQLKVCLAQW